MGTHYDQPNESERAVIGRLHADEAVNLFALAIRHGPTAPNLRTTTFACPTGASDIACML